VAHRENPPTRILLHTFRRLSLATVARMARAHGGDLTTALTFTSMAFSSGAEAYARALAGDGEVSAASAHAVSISTGIPYESVRTRVNTLCRIGLLRRAGDGFAIGADALLSPERIALRAGVAADARVALEEMLSFGLHCPSPSPPPEPIGRLSESDRLAIHVLWFTLQAYMRFRGVTHSFMRGYMLAALIEANTRHHFDSPDHAWRYAYLDTELPDSERRPVTIRTLAAELSLPLESARRRLHELESEGLVKYVAGQGAIVPAAVFGPGTPMTAATADLPARLQSLLAEIAAWGLSEPLGGVPKVA
jgi:DNA-binding transcriptional regulator YhcF (GntR family)